jgi:Na+-translocating ferredoxin:NAD+ oxidoreductase RnfG subunit
MRKLLLILTLVTCLAGPLLADDSLSIEDKIAKAVKVQGTVVGENIVPAAILDDLIARVGDTFLVDEASGRLIARLGTEELDDHPANLQVKVISILHGNVVISHLDVNISLLARQ